MKWYLAISEASIARPDHGWPDLIRAAVMSARRNTSLIPHMLYDGPEGAFTNEMKHLGVKVIHHRTCLYDTLARYPEGNPVFLAVAAGAFLRLDIPLLESCDDFVLYTDCDVIFRKHPDFFGASRPRFFSATSQTGDDPAEDMNSGVMLMNVPALRAEHSAMVNFIRNNLQNLKLGFDQPMLRAFFERRYDPMDRSLNWKPYWGHNPNAQIIHFHGPKPVYIKELIAEPTLDKHAGWKPFYQRSPSGYQTYVKLWDDMLGIAQGHAAAA